MKIIPTGHRLVVKLQKAETTSRGGIIIETEETASRANFAAQFGTVMAIGPNAFKDFGDGKPWCKTGDKVMLAKYSGVDQMDPASKDIFRIINDEDVFAVVKEDK